MAVLDKPIEPRDYNNYLNTCELHPPKGGCFLLHR